MTHRESRSLVLTKKNQRKNPLKPQPNPTNRSPSLSSDGRRSCREIPAGSMATPGRKGRDGDRRLLRHRPRALLDARQSRLQHRSRRSEDRPLEISMRRDQSDGIFGSSAIRRPIRGRGARRHRPGLPHRSVRAEGLGRLRSDRCLG